MPRKPLSGTRGRTRYRRFWLNAFAFIWATTGWPGADTSLPPPALRPFSRPSMVCWPKDPWKPPCSWGALFWRVSPACLHAYAFVWAIKTLLIGKPYNLPRNFHEGTCFADSGFESLSRPWLAQDPAP